LLDGLVHIGIDELSYLRHHKYVTTVVDHERQRVVWASTGKSAATLDKFFDELGPERTAKIQSATMDMSGAFTKGVTMRAPGALIIYDKFHVLRLAQDAVDQVRRSEVRRLEDAGDRKTLKKVRWPLLKNEWNLTRVEKDRLASLQRTNRKLYRAYLLKSALADALAGSQIHVARTKLLEWISWASRSRLAPFKRVAATIKKLFAGVLAIVDTGFNNGRVEGLNGKIRVITRRAYGFHSAPALISLIFLCCSGIDLHPIFKTPIHFH
jgi:transposase